MPANAALIHPGEILLTEFMSRSDSPPNRLPRIFACPRRASATSFAASGRSPQTRRCVSELFWFAGAVLGLNLQNEYDFDSPPAVQP